MFDRFKQLAQLKRIKDQLASETIEYEEDGVKVVVTGEQKIKEMIIDGKRNERLLKVINKALEKAQFAMAQKLQGMAGGLAGLLGK